ncbi:hypothetical protein IFR05_004124 [Cadophora sp. M221]|nr:hypothetical protein IFR05_004124 [Cadophora sp. M221]
MKFSMVQIAALAFVCSVRAAPSNIKSRQDCDLDNPSNSTVEATPIVGDARMAAAATKDSTKAKATDKSKAKSTKAKESKKPKATKAKSTKAPAATGGDSGSGSGGGSEAAPTGDGSNSGGSDGGASEPTPTGGSGSGGSGSGGATPAPTGGATPTSPSGGGGGGGSSVLAAAQTIAAGGSFDGGGATFDRGVSCTGQAEGGGGDAVFVIESGGSLSNVVIGPNQIEGVHCNGGCKLSNVVWTAVCEDAFTIKKQSAGETTTITGGSSKGATDKVFQFNGAGTLSISGFEADGFGSFVRNCGNCKESAERHVIIDGVTASNGRTLCGINTNFGDTCKVTNTKLSGVKNVCMKYTGVSSGSEPKEIGAGADGTSCIYGSDVTGAS